MRLAERFWEKVNRDGDCWIWEASYRPNGYGQFRIDGKNCASHRVSWELSYGPIPQNMKVLHTCDTPLCVRPYHLFLGNIKDNVRDMREKGRQNDTGPKIVMSNSYVIKGRRTKLNLQQVSDIRKLGDSLSARKIAKVYGLAPQHVGDILAGRKW